jgi:hypothetical protein
MKGCFDKENKLYEYDDCSTCPDRDDGNNWKVTRIKKGEYIAEAIIPVLIQKIDIELRLDVLTFDRPLTAEEVLVGHSKLVTKAIKTGE